MFRRILVPIDGSHTSILGLQEAIKLAKDQNATLFLLHVVDELLVTQTYDGMAYLPSQYIEEFLAGLRESGKKILANAEAKVQKQGLKSQSELVATLGHRVSDIIIDKARKWKADLIVLGTHGRRGLTRLVMGSDAEGVVRSTRVPVLLVRAPDRPSTRRGKESKQK